LRKLVELGGVSQEELRQILNQLRTLAQTTSGPPPPAAPHLPPSAQSPFTPAPAPAYQDHSAYANPPLPSISPASYPPAPYQYVGHEHPKIENLEISPLGPSTASTSTALAGSSSAPPATGNINELFNTLLKAGIVSANSTPIGAGATSTERDQTPPVDLDRESSRAYRKLILAQKIKLNTADLTKYVCFSLDCFTGTYIL
jgi:pre-mRNA cleavage complex 2 protein Pcf11